MIEVHFYDTATGKYTGKTIRCSPRSEAALKDWIDANTEPGTVGRVGPLEEPGPHEPASAISEINRLETSQHRALRELVLTNSADARARVQAIQDQIIELRKKL